MASSGNSWNKTIRRAREEQGWTQEELAERIDTNTNQKTISRWERGKTKPSLYYRKKLSEVLGKSIEELGLLEEIDETRPESEHIEREQTPSIANTSKPFFRRRNVIISLVLLVVVIVGGLSYLISVSQTETVTFPLKAGIYGVTTKNSYTGTTTIKVSGTGQVAAKFYSDAFYEYANDKMQLMREPMHYQNFLSLCINGQPVDRYVQNIPRPSDTHIYKFQINAPGGKLTFGICDDGVSDNTGSFTVTISQGIFAIFT